MFNHSKLISTELSVASKGLSYDYLSNILENVGPLMQSTVTSTGKVYKTKRQPRRMYKVGDLYHTQKGLLAENVPVNKWMEDNLPELTHKQRARIVNTASCTNRNQAYGYYVKLKPNVMVSV